MYSFVLHNPTKIYFGAEQRKNLSDVVKEYGKKVLILYGGGSVKRSGLYDEVIEQLTGAGLICIPYGGIMSNPRNTQVNEAADVCKKEQIDVVLSLGGGSISDTAKAVAAATFYDGDCWDLIIRKEPVKKALPVIAVVTITGTGSEMNNSCVISNWEEKEKRGFSHPLLQPRAAFLDPELTYSVDAFHTACGCADIISHIMESSYLLRGDRMEMLCRTMEAICRTVIYYGPIAVRKPESYEARANLMWASVWALNGFLKNGIRQLASCHAIEHEVSARYDITHGLGMAILLPRWARYILDEVTAPYFACFGRNVFGVDKAASEWDAANLAIDALESFFYKDLGLPAGLDQAGVDDSQFKNMADSICWGGVLPGFKELKPADVEAIFAACRPWQEKQ